MEDQKRQTRATRRQFLKALGVGSVVALSAPLLAACGQQAAPSPTAAPAAAPTKAPEAAPTTAPEAKPTEAAAAPTEAPAAPTATEAPAAATPTVATTGTGQVRDVPREKTVVVMW